MDVAHDSRLRDGIAAARANWASLGSPAETAIISETWEGMLRWERMPFDSGSDCMSTGIVTWATPL